MAHRIHNASKDHGLAFFRDPDARRISQILIVVVFIMGLGLEGMGVPLGSGVNSFSWWKYLLFIGLVATLIPDLRIDLKTVIGEITTSARDLFKAITPETQHVTAIPGTPGQHPNQPVPDPGTTNQEQAWTPKEVVDLGEFVDDAEEVDVANDIKPPIEDEEHVEIVAVGGENADDENMVDLSNVTEREEAELNQVDEKDAVDLSDFADMEVAEEAEPNQVDEEDAVNLSDSADMKVVETASKEDLDMEDLEPPESEQVSSTQDATEQEHEGEDDMREFLKDFS
ncbi:MAG: hypothetical protein VB855_05665 [Pirellulaceae bacterium]